MRKVEKQRLLNNRKWIRMKGLTYLYGQPLTVFEKGGALGEINRGVRESRKEIRTYEA